MLQPTYLPDRYRFNDDEENIEVVIDRLHDERGGLAGELLVKSSRPPRPGTLIGPVRFLPASAQQLSSTARQLEDIEPTGFWSRYIREVANKTITHWRDGDPLKDLREIQPSEGSRDVVDEVIGGDANVLFADGASGKTTLGEGLCVTVASGINIGLGTPNASGPVAICDWETGEDDHADLFRAICAGADIEELPPVYYLRMTSSLVDSAPALRRKFAELGIVFAMVDSLGAARNGEPESAEATIRLFNAARSLGVPWLGIDHVTKNGGADKTRPFGSTYTHNLARRTWSVAKEQSEGSGRLTVALTNHKNNRGRLARRRGFHLDYTEDDHGRPLTIRFTPCDPLAVASVRSSQGQKDQIMGALSSNNGALLVSEIQQVLEADGIVLSETVIRSVLNRHKGEVFVQVSEGYKTRWGLLTKAYANA